jgi:hypothetical protein
MIDKIAAFTPGQARELWQWYQSQKQLPQSMTKHLPERRPVEDVSPHRVFVKNMSEETCPAYGCMQIVGTDIVAGRTVVTVDKPTSVDGEYLFNSQFPIETNKYGWAYRYGVVVMLGDPPAVPVSTYQPVVDEWTIAEGDGPFMVFGEHGDEDGQLIGRFAGGGGSGPATILFEIVRVLRGVGLNCNAMECEVLNVSCKGPSGVSIGDLVAVYDEIGCVFNAPEYLLLGRRGYAIQMSNPVYRLQDPLIFEPGTEDIAAPVGSCRWSAQTLCCIEEQT